jgi:acyl dehydratase
MGKLSMEITLQRAILAVAGTRDFFPAHHDTKFAQGTGAKDIFVNAMFYQALLGRFLTDWSGPEGEIRKLGIVMKEPTCVGDTAVVTGKVARKYRDEKGSQLVDLDLLISNPRGASATASATMELP